ncbi:hypothetical protein HDU97_001603 [Phlyctochytrium planicorne]|nr:hypothetical protein HDU97_001603 [Phlyctochytrium planicorne]
MYLRNTNTPVKTLFGRLPDLSVFKRLERIELGENFFSEMDDVFKPIASKITYLSMHENRVMKSDFPQSIGDMTNIKDILMFNRFGGQLPDFSALTKLETCQVNQNPGLCIPYANRADYIAAQPKPCLEHMNVIPTCANASATFTPKFTAPPITSETAVPSATILTTSQTIKTFPPETILVTLTRNIVQKSPDPAPSDEDGNNRTTAAITVTSDNTASLTYEDLPTSTPTTGSPEPSSASIQDAPSAGKNTAIVTLAVLVTVGVVCASFVAYISGRYLVKVRAARENDKVDS